MATRFLTRPHTKPTGGTTHLTEEQLSEIAIQALQADNLSIISPSLHDTVLNGPVPPGGRNERHAAPSHDGEPGYSSSYDLGVIHTRSSISPDMIQSLTKALASHGTGPEVAASVHPCQYCLYIFASEEDHPARHCCGFATAATTRCANCNKIGHKTKFCKELAPRGRSAKRPRATGANRTPIGLQRPRTAPGAPQRRRQASRIVINPHVRRSLDDKVNSALEAPRESRQFMMRAPPSTAPSQVNAQGVPRRICKTGQDMSVIQLAITFHVAPNGEIVMSTTLCDGGSDGTYLLPHLSIVDPNLKGNGTVGASLATGFSGTPVQTGPRAVGNVIIDGFKIIMHGRQFSGKASHAWNIMSNGAILNCAADTPRLRSEAASNSDHMPVIHMTPWALTNCRKQVNAGFKKIQIWYLNEKNQPCKGFTAKHIPDAPQNGWKKGLNPVVPELQQPTMTFSAADCAPEDMIEDPAWHYRADHCHQKWLDEHYWPARVAEAVSQSAANRSRLVKTPVCSGMYIQYERVSDVTEQLVNPSARTLNAHGYYDKPRRERTLGNRKRTPPHSDESKAC